MCSLSKVEKQPWKVEQKVREGFSHRRDLFQTFIPETLSRDTSIIAAAAVEKFFCSEPLEGSHCRANNANNEQLTPTCHHKYDRKEVL